MAAAGWLRRAAAGWVRRAAASSLPRLPPGLPLIPPPSPALLTEAESLVVPGLGAAAGPAMELMAVPKKDRTVITEKSYAAPKVTNDGVTLAKSIEFNDRVKNIGASLVNQVANATNDTPVDGSTCTWANVLTKGITKGCKSIAARMKAMDLSHGTSMASDVAVVNLKCMERMISASEEIAQVATISDYWERGIGELIAKSMEKVGNEGVITIVDGNTLHNDLEVVEGMKLDKCYISPYFIAIQKNQKCELNDPLIKVVELTPKNRKPLLIVAEDVESEALCTWIIDKLCGCVKVCAVKASGFGESRKANLQDLGILTGGEVITEELGLNLDNFEPQMLGTRKKVTISKDNTIILAGAGDKKAIEDRVDKIDGASELKVGEKKDRLTGAQNSTKAAVEGTVPDTACATSLTKAIFTTKGCKSLASGMNVMDLRCGMIPNSLCCPMPRGTKAIFTTKGCKSFAAGTNAMDLRRGISLNSLCCPMPRGVMWTTPVKRVARGYNTTSQNPHPHLVTFESASNYFLRGPELVVHVPDLTRDLYKLVKYNADRPILLTESGKLLSRSLVECVITLHEHNLCLKHKLDLGSLLVSSLGTFKLANMETIPLAKESRSDDLANVSSVLEEMMILAHGDRVMQYLPLDYSGLLNDLTNPNTANEFLRYHPAHLPATTYALAFMKLHGLLMMQGLANVDYLAAYNILDQLPYQDGPDVWTKTAKKNRLLKAWLKHRHYDAANPFHIMEFGRNVMVGHPLDQRGTAAAFLPYGSPPYTEEAVNILFQHSYPELLPQLLDLVLTHFGKYYPDWIRSLGFENLFPGVPPYYLHKE